MQLIPQNQRFYLVYGAENVAVQRERLGLLP
jgi:hypothetical protein